MAAARIGKRGKHRIQPCIAFVIHARQRLLAGCIRTEQCSALPGILFVPIRLAECIGHCACMHARFLAHIQPRQVEAEGAHAPQQAAHREPTGVQALVGLQAVQDQLQVVFQLGRAGVGTRGIVQRGLQARAHQIVEQPVRHVAVARTRACGVLRQQRAVALQLLAQCRAHRHQRGRLAEQAGQLPEFLLITVQHRTPLRIQRAGDGDGIHVGVAIHVAADPGAKAQQPRQGRHAAVGFFDGVFEGFVHHRDHAIQHLGEIEAHMLALVFHGGAHRRGVGGLPGRGQGHAEARRVGGALVGRAHAVQVVDQAGDHQLLFFQQRAAHRFGGMRGEHRLHVDPRQPLAEFVQRHALRLEPAQGIVQPVRLRRVGAAALVFAAAADAVHALGDVDHLEISAEGAHQRLGLARLAPGQLLAQRRRRGIALAARNRRGADAFDLIEEFRRDLLGEQVTDQCTKPTHIVAQGKIGGSEHKTAAVLVHRKRTPSQAQSRRRLTQKD
ncbi:3-oxoacyl-(acyl-carrier-protein) synthase [Xanthomonas arboricola pv. pruni str. MAFF 311562]|uniref:3-oxoacyl-(Acyl-carrier-protein) synthase n=1 Tax=Xanthomonas arboricola pv. pruni str. MAFF 311562 TaxID=1414836 RepID=W4S8K8_9XANT|nr:3-oxoacyl-(acyl-carrier-protein) synthase [Xanthomonas arboricola pv. pruni str. MAFF 311562]